MLEFDDKIVQSDALMESTIPFLYADLLVATLAACKYQHALRKLRVARR